jgi:stage II sporulation protein P
MKQVRFKQVLKRLVVIMVMLMFLFLSNWLAPLAAKRNTINSFYLLSWGAPAVFYEDIDGIGASFKLEPWRILGLQLPAFASVKPSDWQAIITPPQPQKPNKPVSVPVAGGVVIYHSHASEGFVPSSGQARSIDFSKTVVELGRIIAGALEDKNIPVYQSQDYFDKVYNKSYAESRQFVLETLEARPDVVLMLDLHRDGVGKTAEAGREITTATVNSRPAGQIMFVISSAHENWQKNNRVANDLHNLTEDKYPGLSRGIIIRLNSTYNQELHPGAILVEIGGHWNTLEEAVYGAQLFAEILVEYFGGVQ